MIDSPLFRDVPDLERRARSLEADTSWLAARIDRAAAGELCEIVYGLLAEHGPMTDDQIYGHYLLGGGLRTAQRLRTARAELARPKRGEPRIRESQQMGLSSLGNRARRWEVA